MPEFTQNTEKRGIQKSRELVIPDNQTLMASSNGRKNIFSRMMKSRQVANIPQSEDQKPSEALLVWQNAQRYFDLVSDPDLVEFASYRIEAARKCYGYLLKKERERDNVQPEL